jgi:hypothetical protein
MKSKARVLVFDIETAPILGHVWSIWEQNVGLNQIKTDWHLLSFAAKWLGDPVSKIMYLDQRGKSNIEDDRALLAVLWKLLNEADVVITQNGVSFDAKKLNARFILNGFPPPSPYKHIDTKLIASKKFGFTSNKLEYLTDKLCKKYKKLKHHKFEGFELWKECLAGNAAAWREMERYNKHDVLALEELYYVLAPWDSYINFSLYEEEDVHLCSCGSTKHRKQGFVYTSAGKFQQYQCCKCGAWTRSKDNLFAQSKRKSLRMGQ